MRYWLLTLCEEDIYLGVDRWAEQLLRLFEKADTRGQESQLKFRPKREKNKLNEERKYFRRLLSEKPRYFLTML